MDASRMLRGFAALAVAAGLVAAAASAAPVEPSGGVSDRGSTAVPALATLQEPTPTVDVSLESKLAEYVAGQEGRYGIAVWHLGDGRVARVDAADRFKMASMYKLLVMYRVFQQIDLSQLDSSEEINIIPEDTVESAAGYDLGTGDVVSVEQALDAMITASSNSAAYALARTVGGWPVVNSAADELEMTDTTWNETYWSTPDDVARFFVTLAEGRLIGEEPSMQMIDLLLDQQIDDRIPALLPDEAEVAHKTGELADVRNDGGIVRGPDGHYVIVVMSDGVDPQAATGAIAEISRMVYDTYGSSAQP